jgi:hypothetical protein
MRFTNFIFIVGIVASVVYVLSLLFQVMHWPFFREIRYASLGLMALGLILYGIDWYQHRRKRPSSKSLEEDDEWED